MAKTKDAVLTPGQKELMEKEYLDFVKPSTYGNKANPSSCDSLYDDVENPELRAIVEKVAATTPYREETSPNEAQSPPNPLKRISGKQRKATLEEFDLRFPCLRFLRKIGNIKCNVRRHRFGIVQNHAHHAVSHANIRYHL